MTVKKGGGRRKSLWHGNETIRLPEHPRKGGGHVHRDGHCYEAGMRFNEADCQGGGRESGNPGSVGGAESTRAAAANPTCPHGVRWRKECPDCLNERIRELEADYKRMREAFEDCHAQMSMAEARVKDLDDEAVHYRTRVKELEFERENLAAALALHMEIRRTDPDEKERLG